MRIYNILRLLDGPNSFEKTEFIEDKFSLSAFFFQSLWLFYHRLWLHGIIVIFIQYNLTAALNHNIINHSSFLGLELSVMLLVALQAKDWHINKLLKDNYIFTDLIVAKNLDEAKLRFYQKSMENYDV